MLIGLFLTTKDDLFLPYAQTQRNIMKSKFRVIEGGKDRIPNYTHIIGQHYDAQAQKLLDEYYKNSGMQKPDDTTILKIHLSVIVEFFEQGKFDTSYFNQEVESTFNIFHDLDKKEKWSVIENLNMD